MLHNYVFFCVDDAKCISRISNLLLHLSAIQNDNTSVAQSGLVTSSHFATTAGTTTTATSKQCLKMDPDPLIYISTKENHFKNKYELNLSILCCCSNCLYLHHLFQKKWKRYHNINATCDFTLTKNLVIFIIRKHTLTIDTYLSSKKTLSFVYFILVVMMLLIK